MSMFGLRNGDGYSRYIGMPADRDYAARWAKWAERGDANRDPGCRFDEAAVRVFPRAAGIGNKYFRNPYSHC
jgi:hypothetical protein